MCGLAPAEARDLRVLADPCPQARLASAGSGAGRTGAERGRGVSGGGGRPAPLPRVDRVVVQCVPLDSGVGEEGVPAAKALAGNPPYTLRRTDDQKSIKGHRWTDTEVCPYSVANTKDPE